MRTIGAIRRDRTAVSPVIATILMVAITVVLAAVLYVMVSGLVTGPGGTPEAMGVSVSKTPDGTNWKLTFSKVPTGKTPATVYLVVYYANGTVAMSKTALSSLSGGAQYVQADATATTIQAGDSVLLSVSTYPSGSSYDIVDDNGILNTGKLQ